MIKWLDGFGLLGVEKAADLIADTGASPGDPVYLEDTSPAEITGADKAAMASVIASVFPSAVLASVFKLVCERQAGNLPACQIFENKQTTTAEFVAIEAASPQTEILTFDGSLVSLVFESASRMTRQQTVSMKSVIESVWPTIEAEDMFGLEVEISGEAFGVLTHVTASGADTYVALRSKGLARLVGLVA